MNGLESSFSISRAYARWRAGSWAAHTNKKKIKHQLTRWLFEGACAGTHVLVHPCRSDESAAAELSSNKEREQTNLRNQIKLNGGDANLMLLARR